MPSLLSGSALRKGGSNTFIKLSGAQPQLPPTPTTATGFTLVTNDVLVTTYSSSLGFLDFDNGIITNHNQGENIVLNATGTSVVVITGTTDSSSTTTGALVVGGGVGIGGNIYAHKDIFVNSLRIGQGIDNANNIVIANTTTYVVNEGLQNGQESIIIGWGSLQGLATANKAIAIGRLALSSGTSILECIAIGDQSLANLGTQPVYTRANITGALNSNPAAITVVANGLKPNDKIMISGVEGMTQLNGQTFYVNKSGPDTLLLYSDLNLYFPIDATGFGTYTGNGVIEKVLLRNNNIAVGNMAGFSLIDGQKNFFMGDNIASNLNTGTSNFFLGHDVANNVKIGSRNISIMGDQIKNNVDDQISIGAIFYYNGDQLLTLDTNALVGYGNTSTDVNSGALVVSGGVGISGNSYIGGPVVITTSSVSAGVSSGALVVTGGVGIGGSLNVGANLVATGDGEVTLTPVSGNVTIEPTDGGHVFIYSSEIGNMDNLVIGNSTPQLGYFTDLSAQSISVSNTTSSTSTTTGAVTVAGGVGIRGNVYARSGSPDENYLLYSPRVTVQPTASPPNNPRVGDVWIAVDLGLSLIYAQDGANKIWIQLSGL